MFAASNECMKLAIRDLFIDGYEYLSVGILIVIGLDAFKSGVLTRLATVSTVAPYTFIPAGVIQNTGLLTLASTETIESRYFLRGFIGVNRSCTVWKTVEPSLPASCPDKRIGLPECVYSPGTM